MSRYSVFVLVLFFFIIYSARANDINNFINQDHNVVAKYQNVKIDNKTKQSIMRKIIIYQNNPLNNKAKQLAQQSYTVYKKRKDVNQSLASIYNKGKKIINTLEDVNQILPPNSYIFIFMSSSVPYATWHNYAVAIDKLRRQGQGNIGLILRGCIGGCKKVMPTIFFIQRVVQNKKLKVPILIDPLLFRLYDITKVPTFVYAKNVNLYNTRLSMGLTKNLKNKIIAYKVKGDWSLSYQIKQLYQKSGDKELFKLLKLLSESWFAKP